MQSEPAIESRAATRGRRRKRGAGPVFVDNSGRRSKALRRIGLLVGVGCLAYAVILGAAFMGWGSSLTPSSLLPFGRGDQVGAPRGVPTGAPTGSPPALPSGATPTSAPSPSASPSASASAG
ncbi:hypothetical protein [Streptomyces acidiscabies]|uniref:Uncharacterized protein n=1 Tax=Streptomyces acidiscabies TaxID=42234 RepID=A0AAP6BA50_9ACTN|nr:hypothetical protein [Streptomyces acidiscabies]MBP5937674.1 hypothetical protein [Streptomyces sp. LBUM 1476]MBZ3914217.1 hypothetical protein [Streptomyces acidiscabies]MDX2960850.1 hypothetical protein [Streptomyces acidiscabies]MDX3016907.1 hypothetical protein [Streptomyces acidiscabies]MDX3788859.1 hypothetical protein [Streptomyces acidiscabies]